MTNASIPPRMFTSEVLRIAKFGRAKLMARRRQHTFPDPIDRGKEDIYSGPDVYRALGLVEGQQPARGGDPIMDALASL